MLVCESLELRQLKHFAGPGAPLLFVALDFERTEEEVQQPLARIVLRREDEVLEDRQVPKLMGNLPRFCEPEVHNLVRWKAVDPRAVEPNLPAVGAIEPRNDVEESGFSRSVRPDKASDRSGEDRQAAPVNGLDSAERLFHGVHSKNRFGGHR